MRRGSSRSPRRAAELTALPDDDVPAVYEALRPYAAVTRRHPEAIDQIGFADQLYKALA